MGLFLFPDYGCDVSCCFKLLMPYLPATPLKQNTPSLGCSCQRILSQQQKKELRHILSKGQKMGESRLSAACSFVEKVYCSLGQEVASLNPLMCVGCNLLFCQGNIGSKTLSLALRAVQLPHTVHTLLFHSCTNQSSHKGSNLPEVTDWHMWGGGTLELNPRYQPGCQEHSC